MKFDNRNLLGGLLVYLLVLGGLADPSGAADRIRIEDGRSEAYLPYKIEKHYGAGTEGDRAAVAFIAQVYRVGSGGVGPVFVTCFNRMASEDLPSDVSVWMYPKRNYLDEFPIHIAITDYGFYRDTQSGLRGMVGGGYRHDSAFAFTKVPGLEGGPRYIFLATGKDSTGDGQWRGMVFFLAAIDYDFDGSDEVFFYVDPGRDGYPRALVCLDPNVMKVRWSLPVASCLPRGSVVTSGDSLHLSVLFTSYGQGGGRRDSLFSSQFGYLAEIDGSGKVLNRRIVSGFGEPTSLIASPNDTFMFVIHTVPFAERPEEADSATPGTYLTKITRHGTPVASIPRPGRENTPWFGDYDRGGNMELYTISFDGSVTVYDQNLNLLAQSEPTTLRGYLCTLPSWGEHDSVMLFGSPRGIEIFTRDFHKLAVIGGGWASVEPLSYDSTGRLIAICATDSRNYLIANVKQRSPMELVSVAYYDYQIYVLSALFSLTVGLLIMNLFRSRLSRQRHALALTNLQLAEAHEALKQAQATILVQEKYRQAKDIAGAFAHEIRNALFPADSALTKLAQLRHATDPDPERLDRLHDSVKRAVTRAVNITEEIATYTKLDTEFAPETVPLRQLVNDLFRAHSVLLEERGVKISVTTSDELSVRSNGRQLSRVFANLLLNSLDALAGRPDPAIAIQWQRNGNHVILLFTDNGSGISEGNLGRVFDAFFSTKPTNGTGIGLAMSKKILEMYGGTISVTSQVNIGTTFTITLTHSGENS
jgi:signal transduction histidine kinase